MHEMQEVQQVSVLQLEKWVKGEEVWVFVLLEQVPEEAVWEIDTVLQDIPREFEDVFVMPSDCLQSDHMTITFLCYQGLFQ
jgi:hypothetical protein